MDVPVVGSSRFVTVPSSAAAALGERVHKPTTVGVLSDVAGQEQFTMPAILAADRMRE